MTVWASRDGARVIVHADSGPVKVAVEEDLAGVRRFWGELGRLLEAAENAQPAEEM